MKANPSPVAGRRRGTALVEVLIAGMLLATAMSIAVPAMQLMSHERRAAQRRQQATLEIENAMERLTARGWDDITAERAAALTLTDAVKEQLPGAVLNCTVAGNPDDPGEKMIHMELTWNNRSRQPVAPVRLTTWVYRGGRSE